MIMTTVTSDANLPVAVGCCTVVIACQIRHVQAGSH